MTNKTFFMASFLLLSCFSVAADNYSIYLVRHAEKLDNSTDPNLSECGNQRAQQLSKMLSKTNISAIYSTKYQRTMQTAEPMSTLKHLKIENYDPNDLEGFYLQLKQKKRSALIVGHSNTTPVLTSFLTQQKIAPLTEEDYQYLYQVQFINDQPFLTILQQTTSCQIPNKNAE
jgi:phosphohistidine phosphatase SixA